MRTITALLALALLTPALPGCPPTLGDDDDDIVGDDDDTSGDDDDSTQPEALEEGIWWSNSMEVLSNDCGGGENPQTMSFDLTVVDDWGRFSTDWGVDRELGCTTYSEGLGEEFSCEAIEFMVQQDAGPAIEGSLDFDGEVMTPASISGILTWEVTCSGTNCADSGLPTNTTCLISLDADFEHVDDDEPTVPPGDGDGEEDDGEQGP